MPGAMSSKTVQVHLNRQCNLACAHCYSRSGPRETEALQAGDIVRLLEDAKAQGYDVVSFSGGEPFLYRDFDIVLDAAKALGMRRLVVTNGTVLFGGREAIVDKFDLIAVSVDGPEAIHNRLRRSPTAYARMLEGLKVLDDWARRNHKQFGIAHTVTRESLPYVRHMAEFALAHRAGVLQLHPIGMVGAASALGEPQLDGELLARTYLASLALQREIGDALSIHTDLFNRQTLAERPELVIPGMSHCALTKTEPLLSDNINPLVIMSNGDVSPICHAMPDAVRLGNIAEERLAGMAERFLLNRLPLLQNLTRALWQEVVDDDDAWPWLNWYELLESRSGAMLEAMPETMQNPGPERRAEIRPAM